MVTPLWRLTRHTLALWEEAEFASLSTPSSLFRHILALRGDVALVRVQNAGCIMFVSES